MEDLGGVLIAIQNQTETAEQLETIVKDFCKLLENDVGDAHYYLQRYLQFREEADFHHAFEKLEQCLKRIDY